MNTYRDVRQSGEPFIATLRRVGIEPFKAAANGARISTGKPAHAAVQPSRSCLKDRHDYSIDST